jgi:putative spermidine/putrescine transport system ATP-binding protein
MTGRSASLVLDAVTKVYGQTTAVDDVSLDVPAGAMLGLLGPSGCGKTTVLRTIAGLVPVTRGVIRIDGDDVTARPPHLRDIGLVFQQYALFPHMTVEANIAFGLEMRGVATEHRRRRVEEALTLVQLPHLGARRPHELSGGQQQRVALARALVIRPRVLLLDEPLSNLDARLRDELRTEIREIQRRLAITTVFVTHDQAEALAMCDVVGVMAAGRLVQLGPPRDIYERPASRQVAEFVGRLNTWPCDVVAPGRVRIAGTDYAAATPGGHLGRGVATIRPHRVAVVAAAETSSAGAHQVLGTIARVAFVGDLVHYTVTAGELAVRVDTHADGQGELWREGDAVACRWAPDDLRVYRD